MNSYLLADDLSGALEAGAAFRARGQRVCLSLTAPGQAAVAGLLVLSSETRMEPAAEAEKRVRALLKTRRAAGTPLLFKKIDSTLRGPVGAEIKVLLDELAPPCVVVCPATPAAGRTVMDGCLLVAGVPVSESAFRNDPGWPITESRIAAHLRAGGIAAVENLSLATLRSEERLFASPRGTVFVCDAETDDDLRRLVASMRMAEPETVFVGGGGLAHALAAEISGSSGPTPTVRLCPQTTLFISGSMAERSRRQLARLREVRRVPLHEIGSDPTSQRDVAIKVARSLTERGVAALTIAQGGGPVGAAAPMAWLGSVVTALMQNGGMPEMIVATGGETAHLICALAGVNHLELLGEFEPGVVLTSVSPPRPADLRWMIIKPGGFGSEDVWLKVSEQFD